MATTTTSVGIKMPPVGNTLRSLTGIVALFLAATLVTGYALDASSAKKESSKDAKSKSTEIKKGLSALSAAIKNENKMDSTELKNGLDAWEDKEFKDAVNFFRAAAEKGDSDAMIMLYHCLSEGVGADEDKDESVTWLKKAVLAENPNAMALYGLKLSADGNMKEAVGYLKSSAKQGSSLGTLSLGMIYSADGDMVDEGFESLLKVAKLPLTNEKTILDYSNGEDFLDDFDDNKVSFSNSVICLAQYHVGIAYLNGNGVLKDKDEGENWIRKAAKSGLKEAKKTLEKLEKANPLPPMDEVEANKTTFIHEQVVRLRQEAKKCREEVKKRQEILDRRTSTSSYSIGGGYSFGFSSMMSDYEFPDVMISMEMDNIRSFRELAERYDRQADEWERLEDEEHNFFLAMDIAKDRKARTEMFIRAKNKLERLRGEFELSFDGQVVNKDFKFYLTTRRAIMAFRHSIDPAQNVEEWVKTQDQQFKSLKEVYNPPRFIGNPPTNSTFMPSALSPSMSIDGLGGMTRNPERTIIQCPKCGEEYCYEDWPLLTACPKCSSSNYTP